VPPVRIAVRALAPHQRTCRALWSRNVRYRAGVDACVTRSGEDIRRQARFLREQAGRCRRLADATTDADAARRLLQLASDFEDQAANLEDENRG
jgi:hypothetical protein